MMTFVNMYSDGLRILATHRLVSGADTANFLTAAAGGFTVTEIPSPEHLRKAWSESGDRTVIGAAIGPRLYQLDYRGPKDLDVRVLHQQLLAKALGIDEQAVREEQHLRYIRGLDAAIEEARNGAAQQIPPFSSSPRPSSRIAETALFRRGRGWVPQKSTRFLILPLSGAGRYTTSCPKPAPSRLDILKCMLP